MNRKLKIEISRSDLIKVLLACTSVKFDFLDEMHQAEKDGNRELAASNKSAADMWERIHNEIKAQLIDKKGGAEK